MWTTTVSTAALACVVVLCARRYLWNAILRTPYPLPPGPRGLPLIGNVIGANPDNPWLMYAEWAKKYGIRHQNLLALSAQANDSRRPHLYPSPGKGHYHH